MTSRPSSTERRRWLRAFVALALAGLLITSLVGAYALRERQPTDSSTAEVAEERTYRTIAVFRVDDLQPGLPTETVRAVHEVFVEQGVPVTVGVIPTADGDSVARYSEFCTALRTRANAHPELFEFSLHGYDHRPVTDFYGKSEFGGLSYRSQRERIAAGKRNLAECTGSEPETFIPPFNTYDDRTVGALAAENVTVVSGGGWFTDAYYGSSSVFVENGTVHVPSTQGFVENWSTAELRAQADLRKSFDRAYENGSVYVQMLHYQSFTDEDRLDRLRSFVGYVADHDDVKALTLAEFAAAYREGRLTRTDDGWTYRPPAPESDETPGWRSALDSIRERVLDAEPIREREVVA